MRYVDVYGETFPSDSFDWWDEDEDEEDELDEDE